MGIDTDMMSCLAGVDGSIEKERWEIFAASEAA